MEQTTGKTVDAAFTKLETEVMEDSSNESKDSESYYELQSAIFGTGQFLVKREGGSDQRD